MPKYTIPAPLDNQPDRTIEVDGVEGLDISAPIKSVNGVYQNLTAQEITDREAGEAAWETAKPMQDWLGKMQASDKTMTRIEEDIIDALDAATKQRLNQEVMDKYTAKKALRGGKP